VTGSAIVLMSDIFISYRRGNIDSVVATLLAEKIADHFPIFFDQNQDSLDLGDIFPVAIEDALNECKVLLALVGPDWCSDAGLKRLHRNNDWVRRELRTVLERSGVPVVPLLLAPAAFPDQALLPSDVAPILSRQATLLLPARIAKDLDDLVRWLHARLAGRASPLEVPHQVPASLPYLCDRKDQEEALVDMSQKFDASGMLACVVHGHKWEAHDELLKRFESEGVLEDIFGHKDDGVTSYPMQLNRGKLKTGLVADALKSALKADVLARRTATDDEVRSWFSNLLQPIVVQVQFTWSDYEEIGNSLILRLVGAWQDLLKTDSPGTPVRPPKPALLWINLTYEDDERELTRDVLLNPLPKLTAVKEGHIREWVELKKVVPFVSGNKKRLLLELPSNREYAHAPGRVHMIRFADAARSILSAP